MSRRPLYQGIPRALKLVYYRMYRWLVFFGVMDGSLVDNAAFEDAYKAGFTYTTADMETVFAQVRDGGYTSELQYNAEGKTYGYAYLKDAGDFFYSDWAYNVYQDKITMQTHPGASAEPWEYYGDWETLEGDLWNIISYLQGLERRYSHFFGTELKYRLIFESEGEKLAGDLVFLNEATRGSLDVYRERMEAQASSQLGKAATHYNADMLDEAEELKVFIELRDDTFRPVVAGRTGNDKIIFDYLAGK